MRCVIRRADCGAGPLSCDAARPCCAAVGSSIAQPVRTGWAALARFVERWAPRTTAC